MPLVRKDSVPDWEDTPLVPLRMMPMLRIPMLGPSLALLGRHRSGTVLHARPFELSAVATIAVVLTLAITALTLRAEAPRLTALYSAHTHSSHTPAAGATSSVESRAAAPSTIPVVVVHDLPVEAGGARSLAGLGSTRWAAAAATSSGPNRTALARALGGAAAAARNCGDGPVSAQVQVTFAPSGVARDIHFTAPPPVALRSCILNAISRARLAPFQGEPVTVSKTLRW